MTIALSELPTYYGYALPRLEAAWGSGGRALAVCALLHAAQHVALPLLPDWRFAAWRLLMFLPLALLMGATIRWRPALLPWLMVLHGLMDLSAAYFVVDAAFRAS